MACFGECLKYKTGKPFYYKGKKKIYLYARYANGQKRCVICDVFMIINSNRCPCCHTKLRTKSRNAKRKLNQLERLNAK